jgi:hypothetical protein
MSHKTTRQLSNVVDNWLSHHAFALINYAHTHKKFAESLAHHVQTRKWAPQKTKERDLASPYLIPTTEDQATRNAHWLLQTLDQTTPARHTRALLATWASEWHEPKDLIFGIVGLAIIGPTLGIIHSKKKRRSKLQVVVSKAWSTQHSPAQLAKLLQVTSMTVVARELQLAQGNVYALHPDTAAWCLEDPATRLYLAETAELNTLATVAQREQLSHHLKPNLAIAISPTVNDSFVTDFSIEELA